MRKPVAYMHTEPSGNQYLFEADEYEGPCDHCRPLYDQAALDAAVAEERELWRKDAERYRWLRSSGATVHRTTRPGEERESVEVDAGYWVRRATLDEAVDKAIRQAPAQ